MRILFPTDVFPPGNVGGAAWSSLTLSRSLIAWGHKVVAVVPVENHHGITHDSETGVPTIRYGYRTLPIPFLRNYGRHEALWQPLAQVLVQLGQGNTQQMLIHAQHVQSVPAAVIAGKQLRVPVVATIRDHWYRDYFNTGLHGNHFPYTPRTGTIATLSALATDLIARLGALPGVLALPVIFYMHAHLRRRIHFLAQADAIIAVSDYIAHCLQERVPAANIITIPNMVNIETVAHIAAQPPATHISQPYMLYVGKLERNKGAGLLAEIFHAWKQQAQDEHGAQQSKLPLLVVVGSGSLEKELAKQLADCGVQTQFLSWLPYEEVLRLTARCAMLLFPSSWGEPLSRVLLESAALGAPILAMPTGGTPDIIQHGFNGLLARTVEEFASLLQYMLNNPNERRAYGERARDVALKRFSVDAVLPKMERLYADVVGGVRYLYQ